MPGPVHRGRAEAACIAHRSDHPRRLQSAELLPADVIASAARSGWGEVSGVRHPWGTMGHASAIRRHDQGRPAEEALPGRVRCCAAGVLFVPSLLADPARQSGLVLLAQFLLAGFILGVGRQGIDLLLLRTAVVSVAAPIGWLAGASRQTVCTGPVDCYRSVALGVAVFGVLGTAVLAVVAVPTTLAWSRRPGSLRPEIAWALPKTLRQRLLLAVGAATFLVALWLSLGIPAY